MKNVKVFKYKQVGKKYEVFITWGKRVTFTNKKAATEFCNKANNLLFREVYKVSEIYGQLSPIVQRQLLFETDLTQAILMGLLRDIQESIFYCVSKATTREAFHVIKKLEAIYREMDALTLNAFDIYKRRSHTAGVYLMDDIRKRMHQYIIEFNEINLDQLEGIVNQSTNLKKLSND